MSSCLGPGPLPWGDWTDTLADVGLEEFSVSSTEEYVMTGVNQLGYLIFGVSDLAAWRGLAFGGRAAGALPKGTTRSRAYRPRNGGLGG